MKKILEIGIVCGTYEALLLLRDGFSATVAAEEPWLICLKGGLIP